MHLAVLLADYAGTAVITNRIELRGRDTETPPAAPGTFSVQPPNPGVDVVDVPTAHLELKSRTWDTTLDYSALSIIPDLETGRPIPQVLQTGAIGEAWHDRTLRLGIFEYAQYGEQNSAYLLTATNPSSTSPQTGVPTPVTAGTPVQALTNPGSVLFGSTRTDLTTQIALSKRWAETSLLEYAMQGGANAVSQATLPLVFGPRAEVTFRFTASRVDALETKVTGAHSDASQGPCFIALLTPLPPGTICQPTGDTVQWTETWRRRVTRHSDVWLGAGPAFVVARLAPDASFLDAAYPAVLGGFQYQSAVEPSASVLVRVDAQLAPLVDLRTGIVDDRAQGTVTLKLPLRDVTVTGALSGTRSVESLLSQPVESVQGSFELEVRVDPELSVGGGARYVWQDQIGLGAFSSGLAFLQATFRVKQLRF